MYYSYHNIIKKHIREGRLIGYEITDKYKDISPCLIIYILLDSEIKAYPIRESRWEEYRSLIDLQK